jgi:hypothetical protein
MSASKYIFMRAMRYVITVHDCFSIGQPYRGPSQQDEQPENEGTLNRIILPVQLRLNRGIVRHINLLLQSMLYFMGPCITRGFRWLLAEVAIRSFTAQNTQAGMVNWVNRMPTWYVTNATAHFRCYHASPTMHIC